MAMNKKEQAMMEDLKVAAAFKRTSKILPDLPPPDLWSDELTKGFLFNTYSLCSSKACSSSVGHSPGRDDKTTSQNPRSLYSTRLLALKAMRYEVEKRACSDLRKVDILIEAEEATNKG